MELNDMYPAVLTIILIGLVLGIGLFIMAEVREEIATEQTSIDNINVTATSPANTSTLADSTSDDYQLISVTIANASDDTVPTTNYTFTTDGVISWTADIVAKSSYYVNVTSTWIYDATNSPEEAVNDSLEGVADFSGWIAVIVVVIAAAIVLGIVLRSFGQGRTA